MRTNWYHSLPNNLVDREDLIIELCKSRKVLHLGCIDFPYTEEQIKSERWLHCKITNVASKVLGVDNAKEGIEYVKKTLGINNIIYGDVEKLFDIVGSESFEIIVAGEIIEHLSNVGLFLENVKKIMADETLLVISTINAFCLRRFIRIPFGLESVHPDHVYYFSHATLTSLLNRKGFKIVERANYKLRNKKPIIPYIVETVGSLISKNLCEGLIYVVKR